MPDTDEPVNVDADPEDDLNVLRDEPTVEDDDETDKPPDEVPVEDQFH